MAQRPNVRSIGRGLSSARCKRARDGRLDARGAILRSGRPITGVAVNVTRGRFYCPYFHSTGPDPVVSVSSPKGGDDMTPLPEVSWHCLGTECHLTPLFAVFA